MTSRVVWIFYLIALILFAPKESLAFLYPTFGHDSPAEHPHLFSSAAMVGEFITVWNSDTTYTGSTGSDSISIPGFGTNYDIYWEEVALPSNNGTATGNGTTIITFPYPGIYRVEISPGAGTFDRIRFNNGGDKHKLIDIEQWGTIAWSTMEDAFFGCSKLDFTATDAPDLSSVVTMADMFRGCASLTQPEMNSWDVSGVENMSYMFAGAYEFNADIGNWDTGSLQNTTRMFIQAYAFNQDISNWNTENATQTAGMFQVCTSFNQDISSWDMSSVVTTLGMFQSATSFNQDLSAWDMSSVTSMNYMFQDAESLDQEFGDWDLHPNVSMINMFSNSGLSCANYDTTLIKWNNNPSTPSSRTLGAISLTYWLGQNARDSLVNIKNWTISGDSYEDCNYIPPDYEISTTGGHLILTDLSGNGDTIYVTDAGTEIVFNVSGRNYSLNSGTYSSFPVSISMAGITSVEINAKAGDDVVDINIPNLDMPDVTINGGEANDVILIQSDINFMTDANLDFNLQNDEADPGTDRIEFTPYCEVELTGVGVVDIQVSRNVIFQTGSRLTTENGDLTIEANQQSQPTSGSFSGISLDSSYVGVSQSGVLIVKGKGGNTGSSQTGILVSYLSQLVGSDSDTNLVVGTGGLSADNDNAGVHVNNSSTITTNGGDIKVTGYGGGVGSSSDNNGVLLEQYGNITAGGGGTVTVEGTGGMSSGASNCGVKLNGFNLYISSTDGDVFVSGQGGGSGTSSDNVGVYLNEQAYIAAGGFGDVTVEGTGGMSTGSYNHGILLVDYSSIFSNNSDIDIEATGGGTGIGSDNYGLFNQGSIYISGSGDLSIVATGGLSEGGHNHGLFCHPSTIFTNNGNLTIEAQGGGTGDAAENIGVYLVQGATISGGSSGLVTVQGTGGAASGAQNYGVCIENSGSDITTFGADLTIIGQGGGINSSGENFGVYMHTNSKVETGGTGDVMIQGTGGTASGSQNGGVYVSSSASVITSAGNIHVIGQGGGTGSGSNNTGVLLDQNGDIIGGGGGTVTVEGTGGMSSGADNCGVMLDGSNSYISSTNGNVFITGEGGGIGSSSGNVGVKLYNQSYIGTGGFGNVTIGGIGGTSTGSYNHGVLVDDYSSIFTNQGDIDIQASGGGTGSGSDNYGLFNKGSIYISGSGDLSIVATGGLSEGGHNHGVFCHPSTISTQTGNLTIEGQGGGIGDAAENTGVYLVQGAIIFGGSSGLVTVQGTGGAASGAQNYGVLMEDSGSGITTFGADLTIIGQGGGMGSSGENYGVFMHTNSTVETGGNGNLMIQGTGGTASGSQNGGVYISNSASFITSAGNIHVIGQGGGTGSGSSNIGILLDQYGYITGGGGGTVIVEGTGGMSSGTDNCGVMLQGYSSYISSTDGNILITGEGGGIGTSSGNVGVKLYDQAYIGAGGFGNVTIEGTGGMPMGSHNHGVEVDEYTSILSSSGHIDIQAEGGGTGGGSDNYGIFIKGYINTTSGGNIQIDATGGPSEGDHNHGIYGEGAVITLNSGTIGIEGTGGGSASANENSGVFLTNGSLIGGSFNNPISIDGTGGPSTGTDNHGVYIHGYGTSISSNGGDLFITGIEGGGPGGLGIMHTSNSLISAYLSSGNAYFKANSINIDASIDWNTLDTVWIQPFTAGTEIVLGPSDDPVGGPLQLSDAELDSVITGRLYIGDPAAGTITIDSNITRTASTSLILVSGEDVVFANGSVHTNHANLHLDPGPSPFGVYPLKNGTDVLTGVGNLTFGSDLVIAIDGVIPDTQYDQMNAEGVIHLTGVDLIVEGSYVPMLGDSFIVVDNDGPENIIGTFVGLAEGDTIYNFLAAGTDAVITYQGNTGNDAVIRVVVACLLPEVPILSASHDTACAGELITLTIDAGDLGDAVDWYWYSDGCGTTPEGIGSSIMVSPLVSTTYYVRGEGGCVSDGNCADIDIIIIAIPDPTIDQDAPNPCYYTSNIFQPVAPEIPGATYTWDFGAGAVPTNASGYGPHDVMYLAPGPKTVKLVIDPNAPGAQCSDSSTIDFTIVNCPGQILGKVFDDFSEPIASVHVLLYADADTNGVADNDTPIRSIFTDSNGNIGMANLTPGHYVLVQNQPSGWTTLDDFDATDDGDVVENIDSLDNLIPVSILPLEIDSMNMFIEKAVPGQITGAVFEDFNLNEIPDPGEGIADVLLEIFPDYNQDGSPDTIVPAYSGMTDAMGAYQFTDIPVGHYVIVETQPAGMASVKDFDASNDGDLVPNTDMQDDTIPFTLINMEIDAHNYFIEAPDCGLQVTNTNDNGIGSLRYALACATDGDTITFHAAMAGNAILITSTQVLIDKDVVFYSTLMPNVEIHSQITGLFEVPPTKEVEFSGIYIISGLSPGSTGAAFENYGTLILKDVRVTRNPLFMSGEYLIRNHPGSELLIDGTCQIQED